MIVKETKTKITIYGKYSDENFEFNGKTLEYNYLGVILNSVQTARGNIFKDMSSYSVGKAKQSIFQHYPKMQISGISKSPIRSQCLSFQSIYITHS